MTRSSWSWRWTVGLVAASIACLVGCGGNGSGNAGSGNAGSGSAPSSDKNAPSAATAAPQETTAASVPPAGDAGANSAESRRERRREERERRERRDAPDGADAADRQADRRGDRSDRADREGGLGGPRNGPRGDRPGLDPRRAERTDLDSRRAERGDKRVQAAFAAGPMDVAAAQSGRVHGRLVEFDATVVRLLRDDQRGLQHQRFLVSTPQTGTLLIAHNTDLAAKVPLAVGDRVHVRGLFEWNPKGGVVHWTHHDPTGKTAGGFIRLRDQTYQ